MSLTYEGAKMFFTEGFFGASGRYAALHTAAPTVANECNWTGYSRQAVTGGNATVRAANHATEPSRALYGADLSFDATSANGTQDATHVGIWKLSASGSGDALLSSHSFATDIAAPTANQQVNIAANNIWWDFDVANSPLTRAGVVRGMTGDGLVNTSAGIFALFSDAAMTTKLTGNSYADITGISIGSWNIASLGVLRQGTNRVWPVATGDWLDIAACGFMIGSDVMFGSAPTGTDPSPLTNGGQFTMAANALTLTLGGLLADVTVT